MAGRCLRIVPTSVRLATRKLSIAYITPNMAANKNTSMKEIMVIITLVPHMHRASGFHRPLPASSHHFTLALALGVKAHSQPQSD
jgi:hypothetical protein